MVEGDCSKIVRYLWCTQISTRAQVLLWNFQASLLDFWLPQASLKLQSFDSFKVSAIFIKKANYRAFGGFCKLLRLLAQNAESGDHGRGEIFFLCVLHVEWPFICCCVCFCIDLLRFFWQPFFAELAKTAGVGVSSVFLCSHRILERDVS